MAADPYPGAARLRDAHRLAADRLAAARADLTAAERDAADTAGALDALQRLAAGTQETAHQRIARVVTAALRAVAPDGPEFRIRWERKRGRTEAVLTFVRDGHEVSPTGGSGGGMVDVAALALRVARLLFSQPRPRPLLILDEPFRNINGADMQRRAAALLLSLSADCGVQFVIASDDDWLAIGNVVRLNGD